jgi:hypothetical protein
MIARIAGCHRFANRSRIHHAPAPQENIVGPVLADLQPRRLLLHTRMRHRQRDQFEAVHLGALLQRRNRLAAIGRIVIDERDLLAFQVRQSAIDLAQVLY